ncbi:hypothetical protein Taro_037367 [Colocasia esculenta]|uniref:Stigma-specific STIG1-like protein 1 n=1 Tax=Colocasia esculenta TaxID=4460 RepID=A0A843W9J5_COLES|nr:hypothetical protein [Colocasia esculenta]
MFLLFLLLASSMVATLATDLETDEVGEGLAAAEAGDENAESSLLLRRLLRRTYRPRSAMTCDRYPKVCHLKGSPGHSCCKKRCVSLRTDNLNCGRCGKKCKYGELCCRGKCVNILYDRNNCGGCQKKCKKGSFCRYGMCSYAH